MPTPSALSIVPATHAEGFGLAVEQAVTILAQCATVDEVLQIRDQGQAIAAYVASRKFGRAAENHAIEIVIRAERRIGELIDAMPIAPPEARGQGRRRKSDGGDLVDSSGPQAPSTRSDAIAAAGLSQDEAVRCRKLAAVPEERFVAHVAAVTSRAEKLTRSGTINAVSHGDTYDSDEWYTPPEYVELVRSVLGEIHLDPASSDKAQRIVKAKHYFTTKDDGLERTWKREVFLNPPYSQPLCSKFVEKFIVEHAAGRMTRGIILLNSATDTAMFHSLASRFQVCFVRRRIAFLQPNGEPLKANRHSQIFVAAGCGREFATRFSAEGTIMERVG